MLRFVTAAACAQLVAAEWPDRPINPHRAPALLELLEPLDVRAHERKVRLELLGAELHAERQRERASLRGGRRVAAIARGREKLRRGRRRRLAFAYV